jgi:hypothetical protein
VSARDVWRFVHGVALIISALLFGTLLWHVLYYGSYIYRNTGLVEQMSPRDTLLYLLIFLILCASALRGLWRDADQ